ncbi:hydroxyproline O-galactosyltransferase GALT2-like isoform X1 [Dioscorea cayenensis subsp. rotundata]|uniref:Hydroxyproline O-galactosyltransferase GALT2-like isoform X1 n=1 Tax=Dioscorea cayennensis subsp. rotundata TaxID=55577 RepID=A0AB40BXT8_DIOCR|nr:hydroxyproline O-galactosyltransferase GALT2-like isoform X1 [Dioscorea cayenensis subsp. rotundata]
MKRIRSGDPLGPRPRRCRPSCLLVGAAAVLYLLFMAFKFPLLLEIRPLFDPDPHHRPFLGFSSGHHRLLDPVVRNARYGRLTADILRRSRDPPRRNSSRIDRMAREAWILGLQAWAEAEAEFDVADAPSLFEDNRESCPGSMSMSGGKGKVMLLPCGMKVGTAVTVVGTPRLAHQEYVARGGDRTVMVSQFAVELQGLRAVDGEEPPKILHFNPRLQGDWSWRPVIEHNTGYRMQWGKAMRCDGIASKDDDDTVDGFRKCERWVRSDYVEPEESKTSSWLKRFIGRAKRPEITWHFPFEEEKLFVITLQAGLEGFHIFVGGRHVSSFPYRTGFTLEDATGLVVKGDVDIHSTYATLLPRSHPSISPLQALQMTEEWKSLPLPESPINLFIGVLSSTNHFAERMAIRKTWMQSPEIKSGNVVARFFVALNPRKEVNIVLKKEADYFGDIVILHFMDHYELVVLKTIAICHYAIQNLTAAYIMKCDDDTFIRLDAVLNEIRGLALQRPLYMGNLNLFHRPLRSGKWAVSYEEWPEEIYPPYANGPGYIITADIAKFVASQYVNESLRLFKMEDVSMGMWVGQFNSTSTVHYYHNWKFVQFGCADNYFTAHYQSPKQMLCLWDKLGRHQAECCNF